MACGHDNPSSNRFCVTCGQSLKRQHCGCGAVATPSDVYCGQCGSSLIEHRGTASSVTPGVDRYDLDKLIELAAADSNQNNRAGAHLSQDDIQAMLKKLKEGKAT